MRQDDPVKNAKTSKEIADIISEYNKTQMLLQECKWDELREHLNNLEAKYAAETAAYNITHTAMPQSLQENAQNCLMFLDALATAKAAGKVYDALKRKYPK